ncbi:MAG: PQQ-like beta-propeller repeat protein [Planctomycetota bacterium]|nr:PQQ-like beta-propeller repeat protein [Planctomycetota bacterium]
MKSRHQIPRRFAIVFTVAFAVSLPHPTIAGAQDWPQWGGPDRNFKADTDGLAKKWPEDGPRKVWTRELGDGYSAIVSDGDTLYTMYTIREKLDSTKWAKDGKEVVVALDAESGRSKWEFPYDAPWPEEMGPQFGPGPNSTPLLRDGRLYAIGCTAKLHCLNAATGKLAWSKDLHDEYKAGLMQHGYSASPLAHGETIIIPVGGEGTAIVALNMKEGSMAWKRQDFGPSFSSPLLIHVDGQDQLVVFMAKQVAGLDPKNGELLWSHAHETMFGVNVCTPVWCKANILFISSAYGMGSRGLRLTRKDGKTTVEELWHNPKVKIHFGNAISVGKMVYGSTGDMGPTFFTCIRAETGEIAWKKRFQKSTFVYGDKKMFILGEDGLLTMARVTSKKMRVRSKTQLCKQNAWTVPTLVDRTLYVRDRKNIHAVDLGPAPSKSAPARKTDPA